MMILWAVPAAIEQKSIAEFCARAVLSIESSAPPTSGGASLLMKLHTSKATVAVLLLIVARWARCDEQSRQDGDWPCWRGPTHDNHSSDPRPPLHWSKDAGIAWRVSVPGQGHASPCISRGKIFLASADDAEQVQFLLCFDQQTGAQLWRTELHRGPLPVINPKNTHASATPACDGRRVYTAFVNSDKLWLSAVDLSGKIVWQKSVGAYKHANGFGASPSLYMRLVIVASDNQAEPTLAAFDCDDGHEVWRAKRPPSDNSGTPVVGEVGGRAQLLINGAHLVSSLDPATGDELWHVNHKTEVAACTMAFNADCVYASGNVPEPLLASVRATGQGDVTETNVAWRTGKSITYVPSPMVVGEYLFTVIDSGMALCYDAASGASSGSTDSGATSALRPFSPEGMCTQPTKTGRHSS